MTELDLNQKSSGTGETMADYLESFTSELAFDEMSFWDIRKIGKESYGLSGPQLDAFTRLAVIKIVEAGGIPVRASGPGTRFQALPGYDLPAEDIAEKMILDWATHNDEEDFGWFWFDLKERYAPRE